MSMQPTRVLVIGLFNNRGGLEISTMNYYRNLDRNVIQYDFINPYSEFYFEEEIKSLGGKVYPVANFKKHPLKYMKEIRSIVQNGKYKVVNLPMLSAINPLGLIASKSARARTIVHSHNSLTRGWARKTLHTLLKPIVNIIVNDRWACSVEAGKWMFFGSYQVINNAIDLDKFMFREASRKKIREELGILPDDFVIGNVARLVTEKNQSHLIHVLKSIVKKKKNAKLLLVGSGPDMKKLKSLTGELNLNDHVIFTGDRSNVDALYSAMDVFALPSFFEGLPVVGIEAQAAGLPVVCSDVVTTDMDLTGNVTYVSLKDNDLTWTEKILSGSRMAQKDVSKALTEKGYNIKREAKNIENIYLGEL